MLCFSGRNIKKIKQNFIRFTGKGSFVFIEKGRDWKKEIWCEITFSFNIVLGENAW